MSAYDDIKSKPTDRFGACKECKSEKSKIIWGWPGVYYDMLCPNGHLWTYNFPKGNSERKRAKNNSC